MAVDEPRDDEPEVGPPPVAPGRLASSPEDAADGTPGSTAPLDETREQPRGDTAEQPPADPWAEDTEVRPAGSVPPSFPDSLGEPEPAEAGRAGRGGTGQRRPHRHRHPADGGRRGAAAPLVGPGAGAPAGRRRPGRGRRGVDRTGRSPLVPVLVTVVILLLIGLVVLGAFLLLNDDDDVVTPPSTTPTVQTASAPATSPATRTTTSSAPPTTAPPTEVEIPDLRGQDYDAAAAKLKDLGFVPRRVDEFNGQVPAGKVTGTNPPAGNKVRPGATIDVIVSKGLPQTTTQPKPSGSSPAPNN